MIDVNVSLPSPGMFSLLFPGPDRLLGSAWPRHVLPTEKWSSQGKPELGFLWTLKECLEYSSCFRNPLLPEFHSSQRGAKSPSPQGQCHQASTYDSLV
jgi:hypothetical protein